MSRDDQKKHLGELLVEERDHKRTIACLKSKIGRATSELCSLSMGVEFDSLDAKELERIRGRYAKALGKHKLDDLLENLHQEMKAAESLQRQIRAIENP